MFRIDFNKLRFLLCDDNPHMRRILRTLLHSFGAREVYEAEDGATALEMYSHYVPDIVITDWSMPIFDGLELAQMIRQPDSKGNPYAPIIMLTGHSEKRRVTMARDAGVTEFLAKPISAKGLYQRILNVVANPRPFIKTKTYFGPDRRRNTSNAYIGPERRIGGEAEVLQQPSLLDKARTAASGGEHHGQQKTPSSRSRPSPTITSSPSPIRCARCCGGSTKRISTIPVARAEKALAGLSGEFKDWMAIECERLAAAHAAILSHGFTTETREELFRAAHDIKGDAATFGYPHRRRRRREPVPDHRARAGSRQSAGRPDRASHQRHPGDRARERGDRQRRHGRRAEQEAARRRRRIPRRRQPRPPRAPRSDPGAEHRAGE